MFVSEAACEESRLAILLFIQNSQIIDIEKKEMGEKGKDSFRFFKTKKQTSLRAWTATYLSQYKLFHSPL